MKVLMLAATDAIAQDFAMIPHAFTLRKKLCTFPYFKVLCVSPPNTPPCVPQIPPRTAHQLLKEDLFGSITITGHNQCRGSDNISVFHDRMGLISSTAISKATLSLIGCCCG